MRYRSLSLCLLSSVAYASDEVELVSPRAIGHAGASLVSDDGAAAALACPAAMARRDGWRAQLAGIAIDDGVWLDSDGHPRVRDLGPAELAPLVGVQGAWGPLIVGATLATTGSIDRRLARPASGLPDTNVTADFPHRYAGLTAQWTRTTVAAAAALRANDWLAIGASLTAARVTSREERHLWAGFAGRDGAGAPDRDVRVTIDADDGFVPGAALGALIAPVDVPIELALGVAWADDARASGPARLATTHAEPRVMAAGAVAHGRFGSALTLAAGVRWLGERWALELGATAWAYPTGQAGWTIDGAHLLDESGAAAELAALPTRFARRSRGAAHAAVDVALVPGFLWVSAGWSVRGAGATPPQTTTIGVDSGGHTLGLGLEVSAGAATIQLGVARQLARTVTALAPGLPYDNPFRGGTEAANLGAHTERRDTVGVGVELAWP